MKELEAIVATAQEQVKAKLTAEQLASLQPIDSTPSSMMQMCQSMHSMTGKNITGMMMCPMNVERGVINESKRPVTNLHDGVLG